MRKLPGLPRWGYGPANFKIRPSSDIGTDGSLGASVRRGARAHVPMKPTAPASIIGESISIHKSPR